MKTAILDKNGLALTEGYIRAYNVNPVNNEYIGSSEEFLMVGVGLPQHSYTDNTLEEKSGFAVCRSNGQWQYIADHRGQTVYSIQTQQEKTITELGDIPSNYTVLKPSTLFDQWNGEKWETDLIAQQNADIQSANLKKQQFDNEAKNIIECLNDAIELNIALETDKQKLLEWRKYRVLLSRIDTNTAPNINWPTPPKD